MRKALFATVWFLIFLAAIYDALFAWQYRDMLLHWEENPIACWAVRNFGLLAFIAYKFAGLTFAAGVATLCLVRKRRILAWPLTLVVCCAYSLLTLHYVVNVQPATVFASQQASAR